MFMPFKLGEILNNLGGKDNITEIRLRANKRVVIYLNNVEVIIDYIVTMKDLLDILVKVSSNSIYAIQNEINQGFVTIIGGHRIGICGEVVVKDNKVINIKNINSMNIRIAKELIGASDKIIDYVVTNNSVLNTLIISPPGCGKTTILRDLIRNISNRFCFSIGIVDERGEIASVHNGISKLDVGLRTDILTNVNKSDGMLMLIRSMGIKVVATDEIGNTSDLEAIRIASISGVNYIFTMHGSNINDIDIKLLDLFDTVVILSNRKGVGTIEKIIDRRNTNDIKNFA